MPQEKRSSSQVLALIEKYWKSFIRLDMFPRRSQGYITLVKITDHLLQCIRALDPHPPLFLYEKFSTYSDESTSSVCLLLTRLKVFPWGGREPYFGTNPIAFGFPTDGPPIIVDMSSSIVARGKIILANKNKETIPEGWAIDQQGRETANPAEALKGAVLPFGGMDSLITRGICGVEPNGRHLGNQDDLRGKLLFGINSENAVSAFGHGRCHFVTTAAKA
ncbi:hypothetical protein J2S00_001571 [Caldalkalibacillus uzonensis]|uniref:Uncharacterized protein n=1 Tax=Caldalkalibacillus uzonensis TaxID=353224 RepID=A0ABU0CQU1_9BACI|nr:Ldh family oxidoreductase [Caldalkalibacillus uzonensis]MDQ0338785.1 hypothetical protein [Caldalkalibacillus uzonensis]